eukprot:gene19585-22270_t
MADQDLDSFFAEINQVVAEVDAVKPDVPVTASVQVVSSKPQIISKPAEISSRPGVPGQIVSTSISSHPVYTYVQPEASYAADPYAAHESVDQFSHTYRTTAFKPPPPAPAPIAPPQVPRQNKVFVRKAADETWVDETLQEWPENDYRIFVGDIGKEVTTEMLAKQFQHYASYAKAKVMRTKAENKARGFGFVSFLDPMDCAKAIREMNGKYLASRPMKIRKSTWKDKDIKEVHKKEVKKRKLEESLGLA